MICSVRRGKPLEFLGKWRAEDTLASHRPVPTLDRSKRRMPSTIGIRAAVRLAEAIMDFSHPALPSVVSVLHLVVSLGWTCPTSGLFTHHNS